MKEASGELNMTLVTIVAVAAIGGLIYVFLPKIKQVINKTWNSQCVQYNADGSCAKTANQ